MTNLIPAAPGWFAIRRGASFRVVAWERITPSQMIPWCVVGSSVRPLDDFSEIVVGE